MFLFCECVCAYLTHNQLITNNLIVYNSHNTLCVEMFLKDFCGFLERHMYIHMHITCSFTFAKLYLHITMGRVSYNYGCYIIILGTLYRNWIFWNSAGISYFEISANLFIEFRNCLVFLSFHALHFSIHFFNSCITFTNPQTNSNNTCEVFYFVFFKSVSFSFTNLGGGFIFLRSRKNIWFKKGKN